MQAQSPRRDALDRSCNYGYPVLEVQSMKGSDDIRVSSEVMRVAVTQYARNYIRERWRDGHGAPFSAIADELGCSALAHRVHGGSIDALRKAALHIYGGGRYVAEIEGKPVELGPRNPPSVPPQLPHAAASSAGGGSRRRVKRARRLDRE